jgi:hypothetical protein
LHQAAVLAAQSLKKVGSDLAAKNVSKVQAAFAAAAQLAESVNGLNASWKAAVRRRRQGRSEGSDVGGDVQQRVTASRGKDPLTGAQNRHLVARGGDAGDRQLGRADHEVGVERGVVDPPRVSLVG